KMSDKERALIAKTHEEFGTCLTAERLKSDFQQLGISSGMTLLVHCSLSKIGWISGGPVTVIQVLLDLLGPDGTLIMPSHTANNSDPKYWKNPSVPSAWFDIILQSTPGYQSNITPTFNMGTLAETFRHWPGVLRSQHPQFSMIAIGKKAKFIIDKHYDSCVQHKNNTSLHLAEYRFQSNDNIEKVFITGASILNAETNAREWSEWKDYDYNADDFNNVGNAFDSIDGNTKIGKIGLAECRLMKQYLLVNFAVDWMAKNRPKQENV
ncbi:unnamed protein product, partial [Didymodactylos carnosus]